MLPNASPGADAPAHIPVLAHEVADLLDVRPGDTVIDCTFGAGGHAALLEPALGGAGTYVAIDRDADARAFYDAFAGAARAETRFLRGDFALVLRNLAATGVRADAVLMDLGVSSMQIDRVERGFSYAADAPLDMRMDRAADLTAADIVNHWPGREIARVLREHGDERFASRIADAVVRERAREPFTGTARLAELVRTAIPAATRRTGGHPAKRTFQALRIEVNDELGVLRRAIPAAVDHLAVGGRIVVLSYQSLEDKVVKAELVARSTSEVPVDLPFVPEGARPELRLLVRGSEKASAAEQEANPRSQSVRLRAAERVREAA